MATKNEIDELLLDLGSMSDTSLIEKKAQALKKKAPLDLDVSNKEDLAEEIIKVTREDREMADKLFQLFYPEIMSGQDRSQASKEALSRALELKISAGKNIIDLLKTLKIEEKSNNIGVFINEKKAGISIESIKNDFSDED